MVLAAACATKPVGRVPPPPPPREPDLSTLAVQLEAVAKPCDPVSVAALFDRDEFVGLVKRRAPSHDAALDVVEQFFPTGAAKFCAWFDRANDVRFLRVRPVDGEPRVVLRTVSDTGFGYFDIRARGGRILDVYSHNNGSWISQEIADAVLIDSAAAAKAAPIIATVNALEADGKHDDALAALDGLPDAVLARHSVQDLRVAIAGRISVAAYKRASDERSRRFPDDKSTPMAAMNAAFLRGDLDDALHQLDVMDAAIGGDPFLDAIRASVLAQRNHPGDLDTAAAYAERAVKAEPKLLMTRLVKLGVAMARRQWPTALATLEAIERDASKLTEDQLRGLPNAAELFATPEYQQWRDRAR